MKTAIRWSYKMVLSKAVWYFFFHLSVLSFKNRGFLVYFQEYMYKVLLWIFIFKYPLLKSDSSKSKTQGDWKEEAVARL